MATKPGPSHVITDDATVTTRGHDRVLDSACLQDLHTTIDGVAFADATQVDAHAGMLEAHGVMLFSSNIVAPVDRRQCLLDLLLRRMDMVVGSRRGSRRSHR